MCVKHGQILIVNCYSFFLYLRKIIHISIVLFFVFTLESNHFVNFFLAKTAVQLLQQAMFVAQNSMCAFCGAIFTKQKAKFCGKCGKPRNYISSSNSKNVQSTL